MEFQQGIRDFLECQSFAVVGASMDRTKYGNRVFRMYQKHGYNVVPVNPNAKQVEGQKCFARLADIPHQPDAISVITPPAVTESIIDQAIALGIRHIWMQPGAESAAAIDSCESASVNLIHSGPCILVVVELH